MKKILEQLKKAIGNIEAKYFKRNERDFSYELYHQMRLQQLPKEVEVTCETGKKECINVFDPIFDDTFPFITRYFFANSTSESATIYRVPDFLIHNYETLNFQLLAIEIKGNPSINQILIDLSKLVVYCKGNLQYKKGILILFDCRFNDLIEIPDIKRILERYPEVEIWVVKPYKAPEVICSANLKK